MVPVVDKPATLNLLLSNLLTTNISSGIKSVVAPPITWFVVTIPIRLFPYPSAPWLCGKYLILSPVWNPWLNIVITDDPTETILESFGSNFL